MRPEPEQVKNAGRQADAGAGYQIGGCENARFVLFAGPVLHDGVDRHRKKSGEKTHCREVPEHAGVTQSWPGEQAGKRCQPDQPQRHEAVFNFAAGKITGRDAAQADAEG